MGRVIPVAIEDEVRTSYLNYAMSVIVSRALPDIRDGLKPVHRRILYAMNEMGLRSDRPFKKCGRIVGDVLGKFHPHGDQSIYDALVRLAQVFSMRYKAVDGQGNFGSVDNDPPAAMRYTEARLTKIAEEMLRDIRKETVDFANNYDDTMTEPSVLPAAFPFLLANGANGIAVGMATNMAPHNLGEIAQAVSALIDDPELESRDLIKYIHGPDFPTGGIIYGTRGIREAYETGRGRIVLRARFAIETGRGGRDVIVITEMPYQVNKAALIARIADLVRDRKIDGISDLRDESDRNGMRAIIELKKGASPKIVLNQLFSHTQLQINFNVNALALVNGRPQTLGLRQILQAFIDHRYEVIVRRTKYDLRKAEERAHILEGLKIALDNIDEVIALIKASKDVDAARTGLMERFKLSEVQAQAILDMRLQKLTSLETQKIIEELEEVRKLIAELKALLASDEKLRQVIKDETSDIADRFGDGRRTEIVPEEIEAIDIEDLIQKEDMVVVISHRGYAKRIATSSYRIQGRGGKGSSSSNLREDDFVEHLFIGSTHDHILFLTSEGKAYFLKVHELPEVSRQAKGQHLRGLLAVSTDESIKAALAIPDFTIEANAFLATARGVVKKVKVEDFRNARTRGITAINLDNQDTVIRALLTTGKDEVILVTRRGLGLRIQEETVRQMGRATRGVQGIRLGKEDELAGAVAVQPDATMLLLTEFGYGKRCKFSELTPHGRATRGQTLYKTNERTGEVIGVLPVEGDDEVMAITSQGNTLKLRVSDIPIQTRVAGGVRLINIDRPDYVVGVARGGDDEEETPTGE